MIIPLVIAVIAPHAVAKALSLREKKMKTLIFDPELLDC
jgi:hypothetical protein